MKLSKNNAVELLVESVNCIILHYALSNMLGLLQVHPLLEHSPRAQPKQLAGIGAGGRLYRCEFGTAAFCRVRNRFFGRIK